MKNKNTELEVGAKAIQFVESTKGVTRSFDECATVWRKLNREAKTAALDAFNALYPLFEPNPNN